MWTGKRRRSLNISVGVRNVQVEYIGWENDAVSQVKELR